MFSLGICFKSLLMLSVKWKFYKILNFVLLISATILFLIMLTVITDNVQDITAYLVALIFLLMIFQAFINLYIVSKNFPYHKLTDARLRWHFTSITINSISFIGMSIFLVFVILKVSERNGDDDIGLIILLVCCSILLMDGFILFCQFIIPTYLKKNNTTLFHSMINSIGENI